MCIKSYLQYFQSIDIFKAIAQGSKDNLLEFGHVNETL